MTDTSFLYIKEQIDFMNDFGKFGACPHMLFENVLFMCKIADKFFRPVPQYAWAKNQFTERVFRRIASGPDKSQNTVVLVAVDADPLFLEKKTRPVQENTQFLGGSLRLKDKAYSRGESAAVICQSFRKYPDHFKSAQSGKDDCVALFKLYAVKAVGVNHLRTVDHALTPQIAARNFCRVRVNICRDSRLGNSVFEEP